jgi:hypothetical protein
MAIEDFISCNTVLINITQLLEHFENCSVHINSDSEMVQLNNFFRNILTSPEIEPLPGPSETNCVMKNGVFCDITPCGSCKPTFRKNLAPLYQGDKNR